MRTSRHVKLVREGDFVAEVQVDLIEAPDAWAPYLSLEDADKLGQVRLALRKGDPASARKGARIHRLTPVLTGRAAQRSQQSSGKHTVAPAPAPASPSETWPS